MDLQTGIAGGDKRASGSFVFLFLRVLTWGSLNGAGRSIVQHGRGLEPLRYQHLLWAACGALGTPVRTVRAPPEARQWPSLQAPDFVRLD